MTNKFIKAKNIIKTLNNAGFDAVIVGGAVRDFVMGRKAKDYDIATDATPEQIEKLFIHTVDVGKQFGVMLVMLGNEQFEVATFRKDHSYSDGRHPDKVEFSNAKEDVLRRDFTINGLFLHPEKNEVIDYVKGVNDIKLKLIRCIGNPSERFEEDRLRILRAIRFASNLNYEIETETWGAVCSMSRLLNSVSTERIRIEFEKIITRPNSYKGLELIKKSHLSKFILNSDLYPDELPLPPVLNHLFQNKEEIPLERALALLYAASPFLFKIDFKEKTVQASPSFRNRLLQLKNYLRKMTFSKKTFEGVYLILETTGNLISQSQQAVSFYRRQIGKNWGEEAVNIIRIFDDLLENSLLIRKKVEEIKKVYKNETILPKPIITGNELLSLGLEAGPWFSNILNIAYDYQLENDNLSKEELIEMIKNKVLK